MDAPRFIFRFGSFELRPQTRTLYKRGSKVKIRPQPAQVLDLLLSRAGQVVSREEFCRRLWPSETFVDFEHSLNTSIKELRAVLGDSAAEPRCIETIPRLGYRFIASVEVVGAPENPKPVMVPSSASSATPGAGTAVPPRGRRWLLLAGVSTLAVAVVGLLVAWPRIHARPRPAANKLILAVLPFENLTGDPSQEYFSDGLTEAMIAQLGCVDPQRVGVIARTSVMHYKHTQEPLQQIARELGVQYVLEGSVRRDPGKISITAQLIEAANPKHQWVRQYDREPQSVLVLQDEITHEIADEIELSLGQSKPSPPARASPLSPNSYEAYDLYLQGRYFWNKRTPEGFRQATVRFEQAIGKDPEYARAYAGEADTYVLMSSYGVSPPAVAIPLARVAALKALNLDEKLAEAHVSLAAIAQNYDWDWRTAEKEYCRAIQLDPNYATAHHWYAENLALQGRFDEAFAEMDVARGLDPLSLIIAADDGAIFYFSGQQDRAIPKLRAVLSMEPNFPRAHLLTFAYIKAGSYSDALADARQWRGLGDSSWGWAATAYVFGHTGQPAEAQRALARLQESSRMRPVDPLSFAIAYAGMGRSDEAFAWLDKAVQAHSPALTALKVDPVYDPLRGDARFPAFLRRVGLVQ